MRMPSEWMTTMAVMKFQGLKRIVSVCLSWIQLESRWRSPSIEQLALMTRYEVPYTYCFSGDVQTILLGFPAIVIPKPKKTQNSPINPLKTIEVT